MTHVTIEQLKAELAELARCRTITVANHHLAIQKAERAIRQINKEFDIRAMELHTLISQLEEPPSETRAAPRLSAPNFEGLTDDEIAHYNQLLERKS